MEPDAATTTSATVITVAPDRMTAYAGLAGRVAADALTLEDVLSALNDARIPVNDEIRARADAFIEYIRGTERPAEPFPIAQGTPATEPRDASFQWHERLKRAAQEWQSDAPIDFYKINAITTVHEGDVLGRITPAVPGRAGTDVHGEPIQPRREARDVVFDEETVSRSPDDPQVVVSRIAGHVEYRNLHLSVVQMLDIRGDVDFESGSIDSTIDVNVGGTVRDRFEVRSRGSISVRGAIEAAHVEAQQDVTVGGGILGRHQGRVVAGGGIVVRFCNDAHLRAEGDVSICRQCMNSVVYTRGRLVIERGTIVGGTAYAREGVEVQTAGNAAGVPTCIIVGVAPDALSFAKTLDRAAELKRLIIEKIRRNIGPFLQGEHPLTPPHRHRAMELMLKADALETEIREMQRARTDVMTGGRAAVNPSVLVSRMIHEGVRIRIGRRQTVFQRSLKGPIRVEKRYIDSRTEFVAVNQLTGSVTVLPSTYFEGSSAESVGELGLCPRPRDF